MNLELFIAERLSKSKKIKKHYTNTITNLSKIVLSVCITVMLLSVAISKGLQSTISKSLIDTNSEISINHINKNNLTELIDIKEIDLKKAIEFKKFALASEYLFSLEKWPPNHPVLTGSIFLVAEFIKFANKEKC